MKGIVDESSRALLAVDVRANVSSAPKTIEAWVDTAFDGHFVFSSKLIRELGLESLVETDALLADGTKVTLETFVAYLDWFDGLMPVQVIANEGQFPLLGTGLLERSRLSIDFVAKSLEIELVD